MTSSQRTFFFLEISKTLTKVKDGMGFTPSYASPELINENNEINFYLSDIYSLGMTLLRCLGITRAELRILIRIPKKNHMIQK